MFKSPHLGAGIVSVVHGDFSNNMLEPTGRWPYMQTAQGGALARLAPPNTAMVPDVPSKSCDSSIMPQQQQQMQLMQPDTEAAPAVDGAYKKLIQSTMLPLSLIGVPKHVFKVRETTKLLLFMGVAAGGIILLDLSLKLVTQVANQKK